MLQVMDANIACWQYFVVSNALAGGYAVTVLDMGFAAAPAVAVLPPSSAVSRYKLKRGAQQRPL